MQLSRHETQNSKVPIDTAGILDDVDDLAGLVSKMGAKKIAELLIKSEDQFLANKGDMPEALCPKPISFKESTVNAYVGYVLVNI